MNVCADCGLELADDQPRRTWNGHVHKSVTREVMEAGASVIALANFHGLPMPLSCRELGFTAEGVKTYLIGQGQNAA